MYLKYEKACIEAGLDEAKIRKIRNVLSDDRKKLKEEKQLLEKLGYVHFSIYDDYSEREEAYEIPDENVNVEEEAIENIRLENLMTLLDELGDFERIIIINFFDPSVNFSAFARENGISRDAMIRKAKRIFKEIKKEYLKKFEKDPHK